MPKFGQIFKTDQKVQEKRMSDALSDRFQKAEEVFPTKKRRENTKKALITMPATDYNLLNELKFRAAGMRLPLNKSEVVRAALHGLVKMSDRDFKETVESVEHLQGATN